MALSLTGKADLEQELAKQRKDESHTKISIDLQETAERTPFLRHCLRQQNELDLLEKVHAKHANAAYNHAVFNKSENLAYEMRQLNDEEFCEAKRRQQLRQNCPELRDLERQLNTAYANKIIHEQIKEKNAKKRLEEMQSQEEAKIFRAAHVSEKEHLQQLKEMQVKKQLKYKHELQDQIIFEENLRRSKYEEFLKEKRLIDELVLRIQDEEEREMQLKFRAMLQTQEDIRRFKENQQVWRAQVRERLEQEDLAIQEFIHKKMEQVQKKQQEKAAKESSRTQLFDERAKKQYIEKRKKEEKNEIVMDLLEAEHREAYERKHRETMEKEFRTRVEVQKALMSQMQEREQIRKKEGERNLRFREVLIAQQAEQDKEDQRANEKRRQRQLEVRQDMEGIIKSNRVKQAVDMQMKIKQYELATAETEKRRKWIEDERVRMIKEHAEQVIGFLPPGVMTENEINRLGKDLKEKIICNSKPQF